MCRLHDRSDPLAVLHQLTIAVGQTADRDRIYRLALDAIGAAVGVDRTAILLLDDAGALRCPEWTAAPEVARAALEGPCPWAPGGLAPAPLALPGGTTLVPVAGRGRLLGAFALAFAPPRPLTGAELRIVEIVAGSVGFAVERAEADLNARGLLQREQQARREAEALLEVIEAVSGTLELGEVMRRMARGLARVLGADMVGAYMADAEQRCLRPMAGYHVPKALLEDFLRHPIPIDGHPVIEQVWAQPRPIWTDDMPSHPLVHAETLRRFPHQSDLFVPIVVGGRPIGGFFCIWWRARRSVAPDEAHLVEEIGRQAAIAVERARLFGQAETANRVKDEFLAMLGHELRNPLSVISSAIGYLDRVSSPDDRAVRARRTIATQVRHLADIIEDLLDVARLDSGKIRLARRPLDVAGIVRRCVGALHEAGQTCGHTVGLEVEPAWAEVDETRLEQVVTNLVLNATKFTPPGGRVRVAVGPEREQVVIRVTDTGVGIPGEMLPRIFDLFVQGPHGVDRAPGGLGLGLALARRLVELHGGSIAAASGGAGRGATLTVRLPRVAAPPSASPPPAAAPVPPARRVLVVEDNADGRAMLRALLELDGHDVHEAADGPAGVQRAAALRPDVVIVDVGLPGYDGHEVARRVRASGLKTVLVALTGYGQPEDRRCALEAGFDHYLVKPVDPRALERLLAGEGR
jgi:signal transduction histidine kinase/CheY-like chemotaxis protein